MLPVTHDSPALPGAKNPASKCLDAKNTSFLVLAGPGAIDQRFRRKRESYTDVVNLQDLWPDLSDESVSVLEQRMAMFEKSSMDLQCLVSADFISSAWVVRLLGIGHIPPSFD